MNCVLGCLDTLDGIAICNEMLAWLRPTHTVFVAHQEPPGILFEYPAINCLLNWTIRLNQPMLYLHTKGAGNPIPANYKQRMMSDKIQYPAKAKPEDCQRIVRLMWQHEFTGSQLAKYLDAVNTDIPTVACPFTGKDKITWQNGWVIIPAGAVELQKTFHLDRNRYYYETMFQHTSIQVKGIVSNNCDANEPYHATLWNLIWQYFPTH